MKELIDLNLWNSKMKDKIIEDKGSIQNIDGISQHIKNKYKIVWEIPMKSIINLAKDRGAFICQSQSMNLWIEEPNYKILTSMHLYAWENGLKTGIYYLRRKAKHQAQQFTINPEKEKDCEMCGA
jgi:ribonucleotide reductase alpha subunit